MSKKSSSEKKPVLTLRSIHKSYPQGEKGKLQILKGIDITLYPGETVALLGPSGSGKSTLLHIAGLLDTADEGSIEVEGVSLSNASDAQRTLTRRQKLGFIYQFHHLLPEFSALENVTMPELIQGVDAKQSAQKAKALLTRLGLGERLSHKPTQLSGGEQQRVAIARALIHDPLILLGDEPTGNLDPQTSEKVFEELSSFIKEKQVAALIATHNMDLARRMDRIFRLEDGKGVEENKT